MYSTAQLPEVIIRRGNATDAAALGAFAARSFEDTYSAFNTDADMRTHLAESYGLAQQAAELADPLMATIVAFAGEELVAYAQARRSPPPPCVTHAAPVELYRFYVDRRAHGTGLAARLMQAVHDAAREFQGRHLWLSVWERNPRAIAFYKKANYVDVGSTFYMLGPDKQTDRVMVAEIQPDAISQDR